MTEVSSTQTPAAQRSHVLHRDRARSIGSASLKITKPSAALANLGSGGVPDLALDLRYLRYAILVAEHGSIRRAADALNLSQSTVSRRILLLERRLGVQLFERSKSGVRPTSAGERFMRDAAVGAGRLRDAIDVITAMRQGDGGDLRIGVMASLAQGFLADLLEVYRKRYPKVKVIIEEATPRSNTAAVLSGRLDAAFIPGNPRLPGCDTKHLWNEQIFVALPASHPLAEAPEVSWANIRNETFLVTADAAGPETEDYIIRHLSAPGFHPKTLVQRVGREILLSLVGRGFGIALTMSSTLGAKYRGVSFRPIAGPEDTVSLFAVWCANNRNPTLERLKSLMAVRENDAGPINIVEHNGHLG